MDNAEHASLTALIHERGPLTVAAFMDLALYHPQSGYYARAARRSGRSGDFITNVDVSGLFGEFLAVQIAEMAHLVAPSGPIDLVEAACGNGRLAADVLHGLAERHPTLLARTRLHLVDVSAAARAAHVEELGTHAGRLVTSAAELPARFEGVLYANELLDALPVHQVVIREGSLREVYVTSNGEALTTVEGPPSSPRLARHLEGLGLTLHEGWRGEVNLAAIEWIDTVAQRLTRGFVILIDYGSAADVLYSDAHPSGTLTSYRRHVAGPPGQGPVPAWLLAPGEQDLTSHVDFTSIQRAAERAGLTTLALLDQTYFLMGLLDLEDFAHAAAAATVQRRLALKTLLMPGGLGSTMKVLVLGKGVGAPALRGCPRDGRLT